ncbi:MAG: OmpA family protein [Tepidimonas ignava]|uniref:Chemotaxis protein MotB n=1 Tax=Tepidimonas ignava TaxID=114249 RepID=A0A4R3LK58_9BURK|nr:OmpA family protein [Tepidimonas ignava]TCS99888.1 chemotaxis protein MotB [Tepidimonas ignava]TSE23273.1 Motility protein B [Tepidimonas ignava]
MALASNPSNGAQPGRTSTAAGAAGGVPVRASPMQRGRYQRWHAEPDPPQEEETWLITYLDTMTLLLVMLVVMLAFSEPIARKPPLGRPQAQGQAAPAVGQPLPGGGGSIVPPVGLPSPSPGPGEHPVERRAEQAPPVPGAASAPSAPPEPLALPADEEVQLLRREDGLIFRIPSEVLFSAGEAELTPAGRAVIDRLLPTINRLPDYTIVVEGHTDNVPIQTVRFPSNWELSAARAGSVVRHLEARGINPTRLRATGYADTRPIAPNDTPANRALNRRVEITLEPPLRPAAPAR